MGKTKDHLVEEATERDVIPLTFSSYAEAAEFWDTHSAADYEELWEEVDLDFSESRSVILMPLLTELYTRLQKAAEGQNMSAESFLNRLLEQELEKLPTPNATTHPHR